MTSSTLPTHISRSTSDSLNQFPYSLRIFLERIQFSVKVFSSAIIRYLSWATPRELKVEINHLCKSVSSLWGYTKLLFEEELYCLCSKMIGDAQLTGKAVISTDVSQTLSNFLDFISYLISSDR